MEALSQYHPLSRLIVHKADWALKGLGVDNDVFEVCGLECQVVLLPLLRALPPLRLNVLYTCTGRAVSHAKVHTCRNAPFPLSNNTPYKDEKIRAKPLKCTHSVWHSSQGACHVSDVVWSVLSVQGVAEEREVTAGGHKAETSSHQVHLPSASSSYSHCEMPQPWG